MPGRLVRDVVIAEIVKSHPDWSADKYICLEDLNRFRTEHIESLLAAEKGEITSLEQEVLQSLVEQETVSSDVSAEFEQDQRFGDRLADSIAAFGGSWRFLILFSCFLFVWVGLNSIVLMGRPFDPYPFILLNLILSCVAAVQAPIIMMSQNRLEARDRLRSEYDYRVNLKAELEIRQLHDKIDHLLSQQWGRLAEIQQVQLDLMTDISKEMERGRRSYS